MIIEIAQGIKSQRRRGQTICIKKRGRKRTSIGDNVNASIQRLEDYIGKHERGLITSIWNNTDNTMDNTMTITRKQNWEEKQPYGRFKRLINNILHQKTWTWLRKENFKRETESFLTAAQNNAIRTNHIKARIDKTRQNSKCRLWQRRNDQSHNNRRQKISTEGV